MLRYNVFMYDYDSYVLLYNVCEYTICTVRWHGCMCIQLLAEREMTLGMEKP